MKYRSPKIVDLGACMERAEGQEAPLSCMSGNAPAGGDRICGSGTSPQFSAACTAGPATGDCAGGSSADYTCLSGVSTSLNNECEAGSGGGAGDCTVGPSFS